MLPYQILAFTIHGKIFKKSYKNNKSERSGTTLYEELNCLMDHSLHQIFKNISSSSTENMRQLLIIFQ